MEKEVIKATGYFDGYTSKGNFDISLKAKFSEENLPNALQFISGISKRIKLVARIGDVKIKLGCFTVYSLKIDNNSRCSITFKSNKDDCFPDEFSRLMEDEAVIVFSAIVLDD